jgi:hypothetical protein
MSVDWKSHLLSAVRSPSSRSVLAQAVEQAFDAGASVDEVRRFAQSNETLSPVDALFADGFFDHREQRLAHAVVGGDTDRKKAPLTSSGLKLHAVRADPTSSLPWFARATLPPTPPLQLQGTGQPVVIDGERFSPGDVAGLLRLAA